ncbi:MAG TPA: hypothetical protein PKA95_17475, partial [Thermomicrobiales bacterium]|nr:hypothetical protein [Thermomicrobiales bacterium]
MQIEDIVARVIYERTHCAGMTNIRSQSEPPGQLVCGQPVVLEHLAEIAHVGPGQFQRQPHAFQSGSPRPNLLEQRDDSATVSQSEVRLDGEAVTE